MPVPRDPAVTEYVRMRVKPMLDRKELQGKELAAKVGVSPSYLSSLWKTGVGGRSIDGFARVLKFRNADELRKAAYDWYREQQGPKAAARLEEPAVQEALEIQKLNHPNISDEQWRLLVARFDHPDFAGRSAEYWLLALGLEITQDMLATSAAEAARYNERRIGGWRDKKAKETVQGVFRQGARAKRRLRELEDAEAATPAKTTKKKASG